jgi:SPP1 family predicted phage head-tail adaptor
MKLRAGELNQLITLMQPGSARDPKAGGVVRSLEKVATVFAKHDTRGASERREGAMVNGVTFERFCIRYRNDVKSSMYLRWRGVDYRITGVMEIRTRETLQIDCEVRDGGA